MRQLYEAYCRNKRVSPLVTQLPWAHHLIILSGARSDEEREFYILSAIKQRWSSRELERQIRTGAILRDHGPAKKVSAVLTQIGRAAIEEFKNAYSLEFLSLPDRHAEADLHRALVENLGRSIAT